MEYPKTENLYKRDPETHVVGPENGFRQPECGLIGKWLVLDKLDGMNMRVIFKPFSSTVEFFGRTDRAQIPGDLMAFMKDTFTWTALCEAFTCDPELESPDCYPDEVILFGEGIGPGIQGEAGKAYGGEKRFVLFDVVVDGKWLDWDAVVDIAGKLGIEHATVLARDVSLETAMRCAVAEVLVSREMEYTRRPFVEGGILRTDPYVFDWRGNRVMAKYKVRDLP